MCQYCDKGVTIHFECPYRPVLMIWFTSSMDTRSLPDFLFTLYDHDHDGLMHKVRMVLSGPGSS
jgi:hypothetical protein